MTGYIILKTCNLNKDKHINKTKHILNGENISNDISILKIIKYPNTINEYYLIYSNKDGKDLTDTYHESIEEAMNQATFEFELEENDWNDVR